LEYTDNNIILIYLFNKGMPHYDLIKRISCNRREKD